MSRRGKLSGRTSRRSGKNLNAVLSWQLEWGSTAAQIVKDSLQWGGPIPDPVKEQPDLEPGLEIFFEAFWSLSTTRSLGMSSGPIPWTACQSYAEVCHFDEEQADDLWFFVSSMDAVFLKHLADKRESPKTK